MNVEPARAARMRVARMAIGPRTGASVEIGAAREDVPRGNRSGAFPRSSKHSRAGSFERADGSPFHPSRTSPSRRDGLPFHVVGRASFWPAAVRHAG